MLHREALQGAVQVDVDQLHMRQSKSMRTLLFSYLQRRLRAGGHLDLHHPHQELYYRLLGDTDGFARPLTLLAGPPDSNRRPLGHKPVLLTFRAAAAPTVPPSPSTPTISSEIIHSHWNDLQTPSCGVEVKSQHHISYSYIPPSPQKENTFLIHCPSPSPSTDRECGYDKHEWHRWVSGMMEVFLSHYHFPGCACTPARGGNLCSPSESKADVNAFCSTNATHRLLASTSARHLGRPAPRTDGPGSINHTPD